MNNIEGWLSPQEAQLLSDLKDECHYPFLEIGTYHGKSTNVLAGKGTVITIDTFPYDYLKKFQENQPDNTIAIKGDSTKVVPTLTGKFGLIFIDGNHNLEFVLQDGINCWERLEDSGVIAFHDYYSQKWTDVKVAVNCLMGKWKVKPYKIKGGIIAIKKCLNT